MNFYSRYRYRNKVRNRIDFIWGRVANGASKTILVSAFGAFQWRKALNQMALGGAPPEEAAIAATAFALERTIREMAEDRRKLILFAIKTRNTSNHEANNFVAIAEGAQSLSSNAVLATTVVYTVLGALEGHFGQDLVNYRVLRYTEDAVAQHAQ